MVGSSGLDWLMLLHTSDGTFTSVDRLEATGGVGGGKESDMTGGRGKTRPFDMAHRLRLDRFSGASFPLPIYTALVAR
jgi:hypothetical protein